MYKPFFIKNSKLWYLFSTTLIVIGLIFMAQKYFITGSPFNLGIDFTGGTSILVQLDSAEKMFKEKGELTTVFRNNVILAITNTLAEQNIKHMQVTTLEKKYFAIKTSVIPNEKVTIIINSLKEKLGKLTVLESDYIGPTIGKELQTQAVYIIVVAIFLLLIYITFRFELWMAIAAILALLHDTLITIGLASILNVEVDTSFVAAILTILGYSINDTIVIFDRVRENLKSMQADTDITTIAETSIWQTLTRSINTVATVLIVLTCILLFGGASLKDFSLVMLIGIFFGAYSSIFIASPLLVMFKKWAE